MTDRAAMVISLDGQEFRLRPQEITALDSKAFRDAVGVGLMEVFMGQVSIELEIAAGLLWIIRRKSNPRLTFEDVAGALRMDSDLHVVEAPEGELDTTNPEA